MATVRQTAVASIDKQGPGDTGSVTLKATFSQPTVQGSMIIAVALVTGGLGINVQIANSGYSELLPSKALRDIQMSAWYRLNAPSITNLTVTTDAYRGVVWRLFEVQGVALSSALDKFQFSTGESSSASTGLTSTLAAADDWSFAVIGNQYDNTTQSGFTGGLTKLHENTVPDSSNQDWEKGRITYHAANLTSTAAQRVNATLSTSRRWIGFVATFRSGATGPARFTVTKAPTFDVDSDIRLSVFGRLMTHHHDDDHGDAFDVDVVQARFGPFNYQYRIGGWSGLLIGSETDYPVESVTGLEGAAVRSSDDDLPRDDGAIRGIDLMMPRTVVFRVRSSRDGASREVVETRLAELYSWLRPQRDEDWELIFRHPGRPLRSLYCRPTEVSRSLVLESALSGELGFTLRAVDPRLYSAVPRSVTVPVSPDESEIVTVVGAPNEGNSRAYPTIRIKGPTSGADVTRIELVNASANVSFDVVTLLQSGAELVGDMRTRVPGGRGSVVTLNGTSLYSAWQQPREPFYLAPDPEADLGMNVLYLRTTPAGAPVTCTVEYRDTWSG